MWVWDGSNNGFITTTPTLLNPGPLDIWSWERLRKTNFVQPTYWAPIQNPKSHHLSVFAFFLETFLLSFPTCFSLFYLSPWRVQFDEEIESSCITERKKINLTKNTSCLWQCSPNTVTKKLTTKSTVYLSIAASFLKKDHSTLFTTAFRVQWSWDDIMALNAVGNMRRVHCRLSAFYSQCWLNCHYSSYTTATK